MFEKFWTRPPRGRKLASGELNARDKMTKLCECEMSIGPHTFQVKLFLVKNENEGVKEESDKTNTEGITPEISSINTDEPKTEGTTLESSGTKKANSNEDETKATVEIPKPVLAIPLIESTTTIPPSTPIGLPRSTSPSPNTSSIPLNSSAIPSNPSSNPSLIPPSNLSTTSPSNERAAQSANIADDRKPNPEGLGTEIQKPLQTGPPKALTVPASISNSRLTIPSPSLPLMVRVSPSPISSSSSLPDSLPGSASVNSSVSSPYTPSDSLAPNSSSSPLSSVPKNNEVRRTNGLPSTSAHETTISPSNQATIAKLQAIARIDPALSSLMKIVASGRATPEQISAFQVYINKARTMDIHESAYASSYGGANYSHKPPTTPKVKLPPKQPLKPKGTYTPKKSLKNITIVFEFRENPADRYVLPKEAMSELIRDNQILISFLLIQKSSLPPESDSKKSQKDGKNEKVKVENNKKVETPPAKINGKAIEAADSKSRPGTRRSSRLRTSVEKDDSQPQLELDSKGRPSSKNASSDISKVDSPQAPPSLVFTPLTITLREIPIKSVPIIEKSFLSADEVRPKMEETLSKGKRSDDWWVWYQVEKDDTELIERLSQPARPPENRFVPARVRAYKSKKRSGEDGEESAAEHTPVKRKKVTIVEPSDVKSSTVQESKSPSDLNTPLPAVKSEKTEETPMDGSDRSDKQNHGSKLLEDIPKIPNGDKVESLDNSKTSETTSVTTNKLNSSELNSKHSDKDDKEQSVQVMKESIRPIKEHESALPPHLPPPLFTSPNANDH